jgi:hypothetical protein
MNAVPEDENQASIAHQMNPSYIQTFSRHRVLFSVPVVVTTLLALWFAFGAAKEYRASASIYAESSPPGAVTTDPNTTQALQTQQALSELLVTRQFRLAVGERGPLAQYLADHPTQGWGPGALKKKLRGSGSIEDRTVAALDFRHVVSIVDGPHLVTIQLTGPDPAVAVGSLQALIDQFGDELDQLGVKRQQDVVEHAKSQMDAYAQAASSARKLGQFKAEQLALKQLAKATLAYDQAKLALDASRTPNRTFATRDQPTLPAPAVGGMKKSLMVVFAGFFAGALLTFLGIVFLTRDEASDDDAGQGDGRTSARDTVSAVGDGRFRR